MSQVLSGVKVLEQGTFITGPAAGMFLADLGASVIKVEQPGAGDPFRSVSPAIARRVLDMDNRFSVIQNARQRVNLVGFA